MDSRPEQIIQKQEKLIAGLEEQCEADQQLINSQKKLLLAQEEKLSLMEKEKKALVDAGNELTVANEKLEKICGEQVFKVIVWLQAVCLCGFRNAIDDCIGSSWHRQLYRSLPSSSRHRNPESTKGEITFDTHLILFKTEMKDFCRNLQ